MTAETHTPMRQAERLYKIGQFILDTDPVARQTGITKVDRLSITEDMKLPEFLHPQDELEEKITAENAKSNALADAMPTSIEHTTIYSVMKGEVNDEVRIVIHKQRVDLGYKITEIELETGSFESDRKAVAEFLSEWFKSLKDRTKEERNEDKWNASIRSVLLDDHVSVIVLSPTSIQAGQLRMIQQDNMTGWSHEVTVPLNKNEHEDEEIGRQLFALEFNLLSKLQQKKIDAEQHIKERIEELVNDYLGK